MIDNISQLVSAWDVELLQVAVPGGATTKVIGNDPLRWILLIQFPAALLPPVQLIPWSPSSGLQFDGTSMFDRPERFDQRDWGPLVAGEWYITNGGGPFNISVASIRWKG